MKTAVYPGSFDPLTNGHLDIIKRAAKIFDELIVLVSVNSNKSPMFSLEERCELVRQVTAVCSNVRVDILDGLLVDYVSRINHAVIIKGLRAISDFEMEFQMAQMNRDIDPDVETLLLITGLEHAFVSSSIVKEVNRYDGDISNYVPAVVQRAIIEKRGQQ